MEGAINIINTQGYRFPTMQMWNLQTSLFQHVLTLATVPELSEQLLRSLAPPRIGSKGQVSEGPSAGLQYCWAASGYALPCQGKDPTAADKKIQTCSPLQPKPKCKLRPKLNVERSYDSYAWTCTIWV